MRDPNSAIMVSLFLMFYMTVRTLLKNNFKRIFTFLFVTELGDNGRHSLIDILYDSLDLVEW